MIETLCLDVDALRENARQLLTQNDLREMALREIDMTLHDLPAIWNSEAARVFMEGYEDQRAALSELTDFFNCYADLLNRAAKAVEAADQDLYRVLADME